MNPSLNPRRRRHTHSHKPPGRGGESYRSSGKAFSFLPHQHATALAWPVHHAAAAKKSTETSDRLCRKLKLTYMHEGRLNCSGRTHVNFTATLARKCFRFRFRFCSHRHFTRDKQNNTPTARAALPVVPIAPKEQHVTATAQMAQTKLRAALRGRAVRLDERARRHEKYDVR